MVNITVRDVPEPVRARLAVEARSRGQSLQAFLLGVLTQQADFSSNAELLVEIDESFGSHRGARAGAPDASAVLAAARAEQEGFTPSAPARRR